jgi:hypothetical protein
LTVDDFVHFYSLASKDDEDEQVFWLCIWSQ